MHPQEEKLHPRPQLTRPHWIDLRGAWGFACDDTQVGLQEGWQGREDIYTRTIQVPFPPESSASGISDTAFHPVVWYRRTFSYKPGDSRQHLLLHCGAVDYRASVWVNGQLVATHEGGHTPFSADITTALQPGGEQVIVIRAEDRPDDLTQPRGKQDWQEQPHTIWYHRTTGIWQPVWLEPVSETSIADVCWTPDSQRSTLAFSLALRRYTATSEPVRVDVRLSLHGRTLVEDSYQVQSDSLQHEFVLDPGEHQEDKERQLSWSPEHPNLIEASFTVWQGERVVDEVQSYAGLRSIGTDNGHFLLNGRPYYLRLVLEQGYWPQSHLAAPDDEALRREVELIKELGFNGARIHQKVEDPRFLYWCDRLGLLIWGEMANAYVFSTTAVERLTREWLEVLARDYSHPCIVTWVPINESWGVPDLPHDPRQRDYLRALYSLTKTLDPTRPVIDNDGWQHAVSDILSVHDYAFDEATLRERYGSVEATERALHEFRPGKHEIMLPGSERTDQPIMITECGGISYKPEEGQAWYGYGTVTSRDAYLAKYREIIEAILDSPTIVGFCYTQFTDTLQETNGLLTEAREHKLDPASVRAITTRLSAATTGDAGSLHAKEGTKKAQ
jgi:beta-galactosidase/beta-glucuronidase